ncbi:polysaccharide biosynthesis C-terminal domain-containing protein [Natranaeroarchaeum sulfidigenes]|uniref:MATE family membrane protein, Rfbx family n=1 Tax=Natranaeroarchaeum sulfidigenes TaxID=2784880 RepID=A0A897MKN9_9EURY|nr:polysaccharide biosynthesis C-terminal domain-containing protein [Natranaeroarchaeum sulfidigenes]QSG02690.1 MATE family membrane protein, Rfbx family [Natranaeroarchaeum sulfidigenes]
MYGAVGAAAATAVTFTAYVLANLYVVNQELPLAYGRLARSAGSATGITACMALVVIGLLPYASTLESLVAVVLFGVSVWTVLTITTGAIELQRVRRLLN